MTFSQFVRRHIGKILLVLGVFFIIGLIWEPSRNPIITLSFVLLVIIIYPLLLLGGLFFLTIKNLQRLATAGKVFLVSVFLNMTILLIDPETRLLMRGMLLGWIIALASFLGILVVLEMKRRGQFHINKPWPGSIKALLVVSVLGSMYGALLLAFFDIISFVEKSTAILNMLTKGM